MKKILLVICVVFLTFRVYGAVENDWLNDFINKLDPESEPVLNLKQLPKDAAREQKISVLAKYFRTKEYIHPHWVIFKPDVKDPDKVDPRAWETLENNVYYSAYEKGVFEGDIPWFDPDKTVKSVGRFPHFDYLVPAYYHTGDERLAQLIVKNMSDFIKHVPISKATGINVQDYFAGNPWNWVLQHWRMMRFIDTLDFLKNSPSMPDSLFLQTILDVHDEMEWLIPRMFLGLHNGTLGNIRGMIYVGLNFPELKQGKKWLNDGTGFFQFFLNTYFYPGEICVELTVGYSTSTVQHCLNIYGALPEGRQKDDLKEILGKIVETHIGLMKPDKSLPRYGDHGAFDVRDSILKKAADILNRPDLLELAKNKPENIPEMFLSFPQHSAPRYISGYYAMRNGWGVSDQYLAMDAGPYGTNHHHADKLSICVSADGANFIVDPGTPIYHSTKDTVRYDSRFGFLHNNFVIDGIDQNAGWDRHYEFDYMENRWVTNKEYDFLEGLYEFRSSLLPVTARRTVFYKRGEYWLLLDDLKGNGQHNIESNFQFNFDNHVDLNDNVSATADNGAVLNVCSVDDGLEPTVVKADTVFPGTSYNIYYPNNLDWTFAGRGWVGTFGNNTPVDPSASHPAPSVVYKGTVKFPWHTVRVLYPSQKKKPHKADVKWIENTDDHLTVSIKHLHQQKNVTDILDWSFINQVERYQRWPDESGFWLRFVDNDLNEIILLNTQKINGEFNNKNISIGFSDPVEGFIKKDKRDWKLYIDSIIKKPVSIQNVSLCGKGDFILFNEKGEKCDNQVLSGKTYTIRLK